jgi:DNA-binding PadR family transcriptional regulator
VRQHGFEQHHHHPHGRGGFGFDDPQAGAFAGTRFDPRVARLRHGGFPWPGGRAGFPGGMPGFPGFPPFPGGPGRGFGARRGGRGGGRRQRRGDVRNAVLTLLAERPMHGYEIIQEITERSNGLWRPSPGSVYPTLQLLADEELVSTSEEPGGKKLFTLTEAGRAQAENLGGNPPWERLTADVDPNEVALRTAYGNLTTAVFQLAWAADSEQKVKAVEVLDGARRQLYAILAESGIEPSTDFAEPDEDDED